MAGSQSRELSSRPLRPHKEGGGRRELAGRESIRSRRTEVLTEPGVRNPGGKHVKGLAPPSLPQAPPQSTGWVLTTLSCPRRACYGSGEPQSAARRYRQMWGGCWAAVFPAPALQAPSHTRSLKWDQP